MNTQELKAAIDGLYEVFCTEHEGKSKAAHGRARKVAGEIAKLIKEYKKASTAEDKVK
jgi:ATP:corrinoid adenosyltransferase